MPKLRSKIIVLLLIPLTLTQCRWPWEKHHAEVTIQRFETDFYRTDTTEFAAEIQALADAYPDFFPVFVEGVLNIAADYRDMQSYLPMLYEFRTHRAMTGLYDTIRNHYPDMTAYSDAFSDALGNYSKYFPGTRTPEVVTFVSEFGNKAILYDHGIGISLDMFLGPQYPYYRGMQLPDFIIRNLTPEQILPNAMRVLAEDHAISPPIDAALLDVIVYEGKKLYFAEKMLPGTPPHRIIEFTEEAYQWCLDNEANIWAHLLDKDLLYSEKYTEYNRLIDPAPTTYGMPAESPGQTGIWLGWQIVRTYMAGHRWTNLPELMTELDARTILDDANYKPR